MHNLRLLMIYSSSPEKHQGLRFHKTLESLPNELRLLHWENYPLQSLPHDFDPRHLVELNMPYSQLHKLWEETKTLGMLKTIRLCHSQQLVDIDDLLKAQSIEVIDLRGCIRFQRFIATSHLQHLRVINLSGCVDVKSIPEVPPNIEELYLRQTGIREILTSSVTLSMQDRLHCRNCGELANLQPEVPRLSKALSLTHGDNDGCLSLLKANSSDQYSLKVLDLSGCSELKYIQGFPRSLKELYISGTAIREVSPSIIHLTALSILDLTKCKRLQHLPMGMSNLTPLVKLMLSGCSELESIQDFPRSLEELYLAGTAIKEVPSSLSDLTELVVLDAENCKRLQKLPIGMGNLKSLVTLTLSGCSELEDIYDLPRNLENLNLADTPLRKMPPSFEDLTELISLDLNHCRKLQHLRMCFFRSAVRVELFGCSELEYILGSSCQNMGLFHIDGTNKVVLDGHPPCKVTIIWESWRRYELLPREMTASKFILTLMPFVTTPYRSKLPWSISSSLVSSMYAVVSLFLSNTYLLDIHIPHEMCHLSSLKTLDLGGIGFGNLPESLKQLRNLKSLIVCQCPNLESLPELPQSLELLNAHSCMSLKHIHWSFKQFPQDYTFYNCFNISSDLVVDFLEKGLSSAAHMSREDQKLMKSPVFSFSVPASIGLKAIFPLEQGSSMKIQLTPSPMKTVLGFRVSVVVSFFDSSYNDAGFGIRCVCRWKNKKGLSRRLERIFNCLNLGEVGPKVGKDHMFVFCDVSMHPGGAESSGPDVLDDEVAFEFLPVSGHNMFLDDCCMVTRCRVDVIFVATKKAILDSRKPTTYVRDDKGMEKISFDEVNVMESKEAGGIHVETRNFEELEKRMWEESNSMHITPREQCLKQLQEKLDVIGIYNETRIVGIVGMAGIGKTYLAKKLYQHLQRRIARCVFIDSDLVKSKEHGLNWLEKKLVEGLLKKDYLNLRCNDGNPFEVWKYHLIEKRVLVVFDNVTDKKQIQCLMGNCEWIKEGSMIVITTQDKSLLDGLTCDLYEVPGLNDREGLTLFSSYAFDSQITGIRKGNFMELSRKFVDCAGGNPLALKVFGAELCGKDKGYWEEKRRTLTKRLNNMIMNTLRLSYDELNELQKDAFLDILCFFRSQNENYIRSLLDSFDPESTEGGREIRDLADKFFIRVSEGRIEMHNLLYTFGSELVETTAGKSRLLLSKDAQLTDMLRKNKERDSVRGIVLDMSKLEETPLDNKAFVGMSSLRYLKVYDSSHSEDECKLNLPDGIEFPKDNIVRYLDWMKFPLKKLPSDFEPTNLIDLRLPFSRITSVWNCAKFTPKLKWVDLSHSTKLISLSGLSDAPNLLRLNLEGCTSLMELPQEMQNMKNLDFLNLRGCTSLLSLPTITINSLKTLILSSCSNLQTFVVISENIETLYLNGTAIAGLPRAIGNLHRLILLNLKDCKNLATLPDCLVELKSLQELKLSRCSKLKVFPVAKEIMKKIRVLLLDETSIPYMPYNILGLSFLRRLCLSKNDHICILEFDMGQMFHLKWLELKYCKNLTSLPRLPPNLQCLNAHGCTALRTVMSPIAVYMPTEHMYSTYIFTNCHELEQVSKNAITSYVEKKSELMSNDQYNEDFVFKSLIGTCFPGCEVPAWFSHQAVGSVLNLELPRDWSGRRLNGIALCVVVSFKEYKDQNNSLQVKCTCEFTNVSLSVESFIVGGWSEPEPHTVESDHIFIGYTTLSNTKRRQQFSSATEVSLRFEVTNGITEVAECKVMKSGFSLVYESYEAENTSWEEYLSMEDNRQGQRSSSITVDDDGDFRRTTPMNRVFNFFRISRPRDQVIQNEGENLGKDSFTDGTTEWENDPTMTRLF